MRELDHKEGLALKNWCFQAVVLEKTLESSLDCKEIKPVNPTGNQSWIFIGRTDTEAEAPILWSHDVRSWLGKDKTLMLGKAEGKKRRGWQMKWLNGIINTMDMSFSKIWETVKDSLNRIAWHAAVHEVTKSQTWLSNWTTTTDIFLTKEKSSAMETKVNKIESWVVKQILMMRLPTILES